MKVPKGAVVLTAAASVLTLSACNVGRSKNNTAASAPSASASSNSAENNEQTKLNGYIAASNQLIGSYGFDEAVRDYRQANIAHASPNDRISIISGNLNLVVEKLKQVREIPGGPTDLEAAADVLTASMGKLYQHLADLKIYYDTRKYADDKLARGKAEDPKVFSELNIAGSDLNNFHILIDRESDKEAQSDLDMLNNKGLTLKYQDKLAFYHANKLLRIFGSASKSNTSDVFAKADTEANIIQDAVSATHKEATKLGKSDPPGLSELTLMLGYYHTLKQQRTHAAFSEMLEEYNLAVDSNNTFGNSY